MCSTDCEGCRRLRTALVDSLGERGLSALTIEQVAAGCGMAGEIQEHRCGTLAACATEAFREESDRIYEVSERALIGDERWPARFQGMLKEVIELFIERPGVMRLCLVETESATLPELRERRALSRQRLVALLVREHERSADQGQLPKLHFELLAGAAYRLLQREFLAGRLDELRRVPSRIEHLVSVFEPVAA
jgi:hypothetical protein